MPSPRPTGSGALKILFLPQLLEYHVLHLIAFSSNSIKPILSFLLGITSIGNCSCYLDGFFLFVIVMRLCKARLAATGLIPMVLRAVSSDMSLLSTHVAGDIGEVGSPTSGQKSSSWRGYATPASSSTGYERVVRFVLGSLGDAGSRSVRRCIHCIGMSSWYLECAMASVGTSRSILELI